MSYETRLMSTHPAALVSRMTRLVALLRELGPYLAIELILPGGSLIALVLWFCRRHGARWRPIDPRRIMVGDIIHPVTLSRSRASMARAAR
ncbi:MAG: hypothetical protein ACYDAE_14120 [Steroidobacteraceae bacterium]